MAMGFDPLEAAKSTPGRAPEPPPPPAGDAAVVPSPAPSSAQGPAAVELEKKRHSLEGTPVHYPEAPPTQVPPAPAAPPPAVQRYRVKTSKVINVRGHLTTLAQGSIVSEHSHDLTDLRVQKVEMEPIE